jgi:chromosome segregation ATPase
MTTETKQINVSDEAYAAIYEALDQVFARTAKKPMYSEVQAIYKTSNSYIQHVLGHWVDNHQDDLSTQSERKKEAPELSPETMKTLANVFSFEVKKGVDAEKVDFDELRKTLHKERDEAFSVRDDVIEMSGGYHAQISQLSSDKVLQDQKVLQLEKALAESTLKHDDLLSVSKRQDDDIQHAKSRNTALDADLNDIRKKLNSAEHDATSYKMQFDEVSQRADRLTAELGSKAKQVTDRDNTISKLSTESLDDKRLIATLQGNVAALQQSNDSLEQKLSKSSDDLKQANNDNAALKGDIAKLEAGNASLQAEHQILNTKHDNAVETLELAQNEIATLQFNNDQLKKSNTRNEVKTK